MGIFKKDELVLDFKGMRTENMSSTIPYLNRLNIDAHTLVQRLDATQLNKKNMVLFTESDDYNMYKLFEKSSTLKNNDNNFSETSPFISSDVYKTLLQKKSQRGGGDDDDSSTSSEENDMSDTLEKKKKEHKKSIADTMDVDEDEDEDVDADEVIEEMSAGSYQSSSAHTNGIESNSESVSTVSVKNHKNRKIASESINTSDINIISIDD